MAVLDWVWAVGAWAVGLGGVVVLVWALVWDRSRGRRRCPRCWYDMGGSKGEGGAAVFPVRCPECGREVRRAKRLRRTRRRWRWGAVGLLVVVVGIGGGFGQRVYRDGLLRATPTMAYVAGLPWLDQGGYAELYGRVQRGELARWEYALLVRRAIGMLDGEADMLTVELAMELLWEVEWGGKQGPETKPWGTWVRASDLDREGILRAVNGLMDHTNDDFTWSVLESFNQFGLTLGPTGVRFLGWLVDEDESVRETARGTLSWWANAPLCGKVGWGAGVEEDVEVRALCERVRDCGGDRTALLGVFRSALGNENECVVLHGIWGMALMSRGSEEIRGEILAVERGSRERVRRRVVSSMVWFPFDETTREALSEALQSGVGSLELAAMWVIEQRAQEGAALREDVRRVMHRSSLFDAASLYVRLGGNAEEALGVALDRLDACGDDERCASRWRFVIWEVLEAASDVGGGRGLDHVSAEFAARGRALTDRWLEGAFSWRVFIRLGGDQERAVHALLDSAREEQEVGTDLELGDLVRRGELSVEIVRSLIASEDAWERRIGVEIARRSRATGRGLLKDLRGIEEGDADPELAAGARDAADEIEEWVRWEKRDK